MRRLGHVTPVHVAVIGHRFIHEGIKGRIIGRNGRTRELAETLINVKISVYGKTVSILGHPDQNNIIRTAVRMLIGGATHGAVYKFLEKKHQELLQSQLDSIDLY